MNPSLKEVHDMMGPSLLRYAQAMERSVADVVKRAAKVITRRVISITPPASDGTTGAAAYRQGRKKIAKQMDAVLAPVKLKKRRLITKVFGRTLKRPVYTKTTEKYPDVSEVYRRYMKVRKNGAGIGVSKAKPKFFVDIGKFNRLLKDKESRVGKLAAGWTAAASVFDVPVQSWISRHGSGRGSVKVQLMSSSMSVTAFNYAGNLPENLMAELDRRIIYAVNYQKSAMQREIDYMAFKRAQELAIKTRDFSSLVPPGMMGGSDAA
jgi:hypothetical protein